MDYWGGRSMRVLVACERFGRVREAFAARGHDAWSCDLLPSEQPSQHQHIQGDVLDVLDDGWDLMIAHPPCKYLSRAGTWALRYQPDRRRLRDEAAAFALTLWNAPIGLIALENPIGHLWKILGRPHQSIDPFDFGEPVRKRTCLWLHGLPTLVKSPTLFQPCSTVPVKAPDPIMVDRNGKARHYTDFNSGQGSRRLVSFASIAAAMAEQWGALKIQESAA